MGGKGHDYAAEAENLIENAYEGRSLFELIQNARDASKSKGEEGEVWFKLENRVLSISNTGAAFTKAGLYALTTIGQSTKHSSDTIGFKGIGFKAVRQLTDKPRVVTEHGTFFFDTKETKKVYPTLKAKRMPLFLFPYFSPEVLGADELAQGVVTKVALPLRDADAQEWVLENIDSLTVKELILLGSLRSLTFETADKQLVYTIKNQPDKFRISAQKNDEPKQEFRLYSPQQGVVIPREIVATLDEKERTIVETMKEADIRVLVELDQNGRFRAIDDAKLYLFYPLDIQTGFRFLIHSFFLVNPERKALRPNNKLNNFLLSKIGEFIGTEMLRKLKDSKLNTNEILRFERKSAAHLRVLYDTVRDTLSQEAFIRADSGSSYHRPDKVVITTKRLAKLLPTNKVGGKRLIAAGLEVRRWLKEEFKVEELTTKNLAGVLEQECKTNLKARNWQFFDTLYEYLSEDDAPDMTHYEVLVTQHNELVSGGSIDVFHVGQRNETVNLTPDLAKQVQMLNKRFKLGTGLRKFSDKTGLKEYQADTLAATLLSLMKDENKPKLNKSLLTALFQLDSGLTDSDFRRRIWLPTESGQWVQPVLHPLYIDCPELRELYSTDHFIDSSALLDVAGRTEEQRVSFLKRVGVWDIPGLYVSAKEERIGYSDPREKKLKQWSGVLSPYYIENDRKLHVPSSITPWFTKQILENWDSYRAFLGVNIAGRRMQYRGSQSGFRHLDSNGQIEVSATVNWLRQEPWIMVEDDQDSPWTVEEAVVVSSAELHQPTAYLLQQYLSILVLPGGTPQLILKDLKMLPLDGSTENHFSRLLQHVYDRYEELTDFDEGEARQFKLFYNRLLSKLYDWWVGANKPDLEEVSGVEFLALNEVTGKLQWSAPETIYHVDNQTLYDQLPVVLKAELQPHFTKSDTNQFGKIAQKLGQNISEQIAKQLVETGDSLRIPLALSFADELIGSMSLLDIRLDEQLSREEIEHIAAVQLQSAQQITVEVKAGVEMVETIQLPYFVEDGAPVVLHLIQQVPLNNRAPKELGAALGEVFRQVLTRDTQVDWHDLQSILTDYLESSNKADFLRRRRVSAERIHELDMELNHQGLAPQLRFWNAVRLSKGLAPVDLTNDNKVVGISHFMNGLALSTQLQDDMSRFDYKSLTKQKNYRLLNRVIAETKISYESFLLNLGKQLDFTSALRNEWEKLIKSYELAFNHYLYNNLQTKDIEVKSSYLSELKRYKALPIQLPMNRLVDTLVSHFKEQLQSAFEALPGLQALKESKGLNIDLMYERYAKAEQAVKLGLSEEDAAYLDTFLDQPSYRSLLYFGETETVEKEFKPWLAQHKKKIQKEKEVAKGQSFLDTYQNSDNVFGGERTVIPDEGRGDSSTGGHGSANRTSGDASNKRNSHIGRVAEHRVYMWLRAQPKFKNVLWVSRNAADIGREHPGFNAEGSDSAGCDITYENEVGNEVWVEVKGRASDEAAFLHQPVRATDSWKKRGKL